jgi:prepilin-type N-terminal cleavage/methylation domain-containing protein
MTHSSLKKGFTLIELIVVIAIVAILAAVSIVSYTNFIRDARESRASTELEVIIRQIELAYYDQPFSGNDFTVSYDYLQQAFTVKDASGNVIEDNAEPRIITAINKAIEESSDAPTEIARAWPPATLLSEASTDTIKGAFSSLSLDQEAVLFVDVDSGSLSIVYYTNDAAKTWEDVVLTT